MHKAFNTFKVGKGDTDKHYKDFVNSNELWLEDFSFFMAAKDFHDGALWTEWEKGLVLRDKKVLEDWEEKLSDGILYHNFVQFNFFKQWTQLKKYANDKGIKIIGDMPIYIAYDSADLWANKNLFTVDKEGNLETVAGVPPDYFSETGQLWGNPLYKWDIMEKDDFHWWRQRLKNLLQLVDIIRIDHFRGFDAYWEIKGGSETAQIGKWIKAPGEKLFNTIQNDLGTLPIIAEDLGVITKSVEALRDKFNFPGIKIMQFAFGTGMEEKFLPHNYINNCVVHTGSHDNDTTKSYFDIEKGNDNDIYEHAQKYLNYYGDDIVGELIRVAYASVADSVVIPMQDILRLGNDARMNFPGKLGGNWSWRFTWTQVPYELQFYYKELAELYERPPKPKKGNRD